MSDLLWWRQAMDLEKQDRLTEAEQVIHDALHPVHPWAQQTAELYRQRCLRLLSEGRTSDARLARLQAIRWMDINTSFATSGGEAVALMCQADSFKDALPAID